MTDYGEEQRNELEALESIYPDSFTGEPRGRRSQPPGVQWDGLEPPPPIASRPRRRRHSEAAWPPARRSLLKFPQRVQAVRSNRDCFFSPSQGWRGPRRVSGLELDRGTLVYM